MSHSAEIPRHPSDLRINDETAAGDVLEFVDDRLAEPAVVDGAVVWNFNSHSLDARALLEADLDGGHYVVPYQVPGVWGFMVDVLPEFIADATLLTYRRDEGVYTEYENFRGPTSHDALTHHYSVKAREAVGDVGSTTGGAE